MQLLYISIRRQERGKIKRKVDRVGDFYLLECVHMPDSRRRLSQRGRRSVNPAIGSEWRERRRWVEVMRVIDSQATCGRWGVSDTATSCFMGRALWSDTAALRRTSQLLDNTHKAFYYGSKYMGWMLIQFLGFSPRSHSYFILIPSIP